MQGTQTPEYHSEQYCDILSWLFIFFRRRLRWKEFPVLKKRRFSVHHVLPGLSLAVTLSIFAPVDLYLSSAEEFWFSLGDLARWLGILALAVFAGVTLLSWLLPPKLSAAFRAAVYACSFLAWIQGNLLVINYGTLDGSLIDWSAYTLQYVLDALLWIAVIVLFVFLMLRFRKKFRRIVEIAACVLLVTQLATLAVFLLQDRTGNTAETRYLSHNGQFDVSSGDNTVVFVLDTVDSLFFDEFIKQYPDVAERDFADFTFYRDTVGGAARTKYAIPYILTGDVDRQERSYSDYLKEAFAASPLINELASGRYDTGFYTFGKFMDLSRADAIGNLVAERPKTSSRFRLTRMFMKLVAFRYAPSALSRFFWMYTGDFDQWMSNEAYRLDDVSFYRDLKANGLKASADKPAFRFLHLKGLHPTISLDENLKKVGHKNTDATRQFLGVLKIVSGYLDRLKELGLYDRATVVIMADHGSYSVSTVGQSPLFMVKLAGVSHPFETSELPLSFSAVPEILISALRGELVSLDPWRSEGPRYFYKRSEESTTVNLTEYVIDGPVYEAPAVATGVVFHEGTLNNTRAYMPGTVLYFDVRDTARPYFVSGISNNEGASVWTVGHDSEMLFELPENPGALQLTMEYRTYSGEQTVEVWVNDQLIETYASSGSTRHTVLIPEGIVTGTELRLRLHLPNAISPAELGKSGDKRLLALNMKSLVISLIDSNE